MIIFPVGNSSSKNVYLVNWFNNLYSLVIPNKTLGIVAIVDAVPNKKRVEIVSWDGDIATIAYGYAPGPNDYWNYHTFTFKFDGSQELNSNILIWNGITGTIKENLKI